LWLELRLTTRDFNVLRQLISRQGKELQLVWDVVGAGAYQFEAHLLLKLFLALRYEDLEGLEVGEADNMKEVDVITFTVYMFLDAELDLPSLALEV